MELIFSDSYYDTPSWEEGKYANRLREELLEFDETLIITNEDIGRGADWPCVLVEIFKTIDWSGFLVKAGFGGLFLLGNTINKNLDAWVEIAKKMEKLFDKVKPVRIDENAAVLLIMNDLLKGKEDLSDIQIAIQIIDFEPVPWGKKVLTKRPDALYLISARTSDRVYVYEVKSNAKIISKNVFNTSWHEFDT